MSVIKNKRFIIIWILLGIILFSIVGYKVYVDFIRDNSKSKVLSSIELYGYSLTRNDTELYKTNFKELETVLNENPINYENYAKLVSKLFVIDVFNLDNKLGSSDIGGLDFIHPKFKDNFKDNMSNNMYKSIESNIDGKRAQVLPIVKEINITDVFETTYEYDKNKYTAYLITLNWSYENDIDYQNSIKLTLINDNNIIYVVKGE